MIYLDIHFLDVSVRQTLWNRLSVYILYTSSDKSSKCVGLFHRQLAVVEATALGVSLACSAGW